jgi:uncharacterized protein Yka (UPF0111/DUF47 family)
VLQTSQIAVKDCRERFRKIGATVKRADPAARKNKDNSHKNREKERKTIIATEKKEERTKRRVRTEEE